MGIQNSTSATSNNITDSIKAYSNELNARVADDEAKYIIAKGQTEKAQNNRFYKRLKLSQVSFWSNDKTSFAYKQAAQDFSLANSSLFSAESGESAARYRLDSSNTYAFKINLSAILAG